MSNGFHFPYGLVRLRLWIIRFHTPCRRTLWKAEVRTASACRYFLVSLAAYYVLDPEKFLLGLRCDAFTDEGNSCALHLAKCFWRKMSDLFLHALVSILLRCYNLTHDYCACRIWCLT
jgi:hypothetical protein